MTWHLHDPIEVRYFDRWARAEIAGFADPRPRVNVRILDERACYRGLTGGIVAVPYSAIRHAKLSLLGGTLSPENKRSQQSRKRTAGSSSTTSETEA